MYVRTALEQNTPRKKCERDKVLDSVEYDSRLWLAIRTSLRQHMHLVASVNWILKECWGVWKSHFISFCSSI